MLWVKINAPFWLACSTFIASLCGSAAKPILADWIDHPEHFNAASGFEGIGLALGFLVFSAVPAIALHRNRLNQNRETAQAVRKKHLEAVAGAFGAPALHVRANVMRVVDKGQSRQVEASTAYNIEQSRCRSLKIGMYAGVSGKAARDRMVTVGDLALALAPTGPDWGLTAEQRALVPSSLQTLLSAPIFDPDDKRNGDETKRLLGTLQIDSNLPIGQFDVNNPLTRKKLQDFADVLSFLLERE